MFTRKFRKILVTQVLWGTFSAPDYQCCNAVRLLFAAQLFVKMTSALQKSECCSATSAEQLSENCRAILFSLVACCGGGVQGGGVYDLLILNRGDDLLKVKDWIDHEVPDNMSVCSATGDSVAATPLCTATPSKRQLEVRHPL